MSEFYYILKIGIATAVFIILMQINWGSQTIETHLSGFIKSSNIIEPLREVSESGVKVIQQTYAKISSTISQKLNLKADLPNRKNLFNFKRSAQYEEERKKKESRQSPEDEAQASF